MAGYPQKLLDLVRESVLEVFTSLGFPEVTALAPGDQTSDHGIEGFSASLGFSGATMRGAVVVLSGPALLTATNPQRDVIPALAEADHADWLGEISNQIVGTLKRRTAGYQVNILLSTPTILRGTDMVLARTGKNHPEPAKLWCQVAGHKVRVDFTAELDAGASFEGPPSDDEQVMGGDTLQF